MSLLRRLNRSVREYGPSVLILIKIAFALVHLVHLVNGALTYYAKNLRAYIPAGAR
jgi:hypothetical protein